MDHELKAGKTKAWFLAACLALVILGPGGAAVGAAQRTLTGVFEPEMIRIADGSLYIVEGANVLVYSLSDLRLKTKIGGKGEGPGELKVLDYWYNTLTVLPEHLFLDGYDKVVYFSKDGRFVKQMKKPIGIGKMAPLGSRFIGAKLDHLEGNVHYECLYLYDSDLKFIKELCRQESPIQSMGRKTEMIPDVLNFSVWENRVYVERSREGFVIDVFDEQGSRIARIERPSEKIGVSKSHRDESLEKFKSDPFVKRMGFEKFQAFSQFVWPEVLPPIKDLTTADGFIYVRTSKTLGDLEHWEILDLQGRPQGDADLPRIDTAPLMVHLYGVNYYAVRDGKLYYIKDNEKTDEWELHVVEIKQR